MRISEADCHIGIGGVSAVTAEERAVIAGRDGRAAALYAKAETDTQAVAAEGRTLHGEGGRAAGEGHCLVGCGRRERMLPNRAGMERDLAVRSGGETPGECDAEAGVEPETAFGRQCQAERTGAGLGGAAMSGLVVA